MPTASDEKPEAEIDEAVMIVLRDPNLLDGISRLADLGLGGLVEHVPVVGLLFRVARAWGGIRDKLFERKLRKFLESLQGLSSADREAFYESLETDAERRRLGEALVLLLERLDDMDKPEMVAKLFGAWVRREITPADYKLMAGAIDRLMMVHIQELIAFCAGTLPSNESCQAMAFAGVVRASTGGVPFQMNTMRFSPSDLGRKMATILSASL